MHDLRYFWIHVMGSRKPRRIAVTVTLASFLGLARSSLAVREFCAASDERAKPRNP